MERGELRPRSGPLPPVFLLGAVLFMTALHLVMRGVQLITGARRTVGTAPVALGLLLNVWADLLFKRASTSVKPFDPSIVLVFGGPFLVTRNPMYLGMVLVLIGIAIGLGSATPWLIVPLFAWLVVKRFLVPEERKLEAAFGDQYRDDKAKVRRWI